ncbi:lytic transglycosylase domain-containing protein [Geovibrio thiophilus]|uniref:Lytic transglycosylase domain-containing protein n=1 Tax=Geovibrio thiophilus TaxID=139438 RepID=A0A3R6AYQ2_9BACT|nr:lytic transglycosylase domain-containing protein [Geovibrio thiophilus]QAR33626.1 lytic transglycosylase domain-containing protein [Geovibrio thiophilus]
MKLISIYKKILLAFIIYVLLLNTCTFLSTFNPKALLNPFHIKIRTVSVYYLVRHVVLVSGVAFRETPKEIINKKAELYSEKYGIDPDLVKIVIDVESEYNKFAISRTGAMGLMQLMPITFGDMGGQDPFDIDTNLEAGIKYLSIQLKRFNNTELALSAYNAGPYTVSSRGNRVPDFGETQRYVKKIMYRYSQVAGQD